MCVCQDTCPEALLCAQIQVFRIHVMKPCVYTKPVFRTHVLKPCFVHKTWFQDTCPENLFCAQIQVFRIHVLKPCFVHNRFSGHVS